MAATQLTLASSPPLLHVLENVSYPSALQRLRDFYSGPAAGFRVFLMPIDACKTILQVEGANGLQKLGAKIKTGGIGVLWHGSIGAMSATFVGHYPWFFTYNYLQENLPKVDKKKDGLAKYLGRNAIIGFCSSSLGSCLYTPPLNV